MVETIGIETESAAEAPSTESDTGADVQQEGDFQGDY